MNHNQQLGNTGELLAAQFLADRGMRVLARNWRCRTGELDIVAVDGGTIVAVEVKTRSGLGFGHPAEAVDARKLLRLHRLASAWCRENGCGRQRRRVDVVSVLTAPGKDPQFAYYPEVTL
ncbi:MAG TPA: YraN family protein [Arthrobacter sp.]|nr:YraN family protein [Arthrobacter sp.]